MPVTTAEANVAKFAGALKQEANPNLTNPDQRELAKKAQANVVKDAERRLGPRGALDLMAEGTPLTKIDTEVGARIEDPALKTAATDAARVAKHLGELHYDVVIDPGTGLPDKTKGLETTEQDQVRTKVDAAISRIPEIDNLLTGLSPVDKKTFIEAIVKDPIFAQKIRKQLTEKLSAEVPSFDVKELKDKLAKLRSDIQVNTDVRNAMTGIDLNVNPATKATELADRQQRVNNWRTYRRPVVDKVDRFRTNRSEKARVDIQVAKANTELATLTPGTPEHTAKQNERDTYVARSAGATAEMLANQPTPGDELTYLNHADTVEKTLLTDKINEQEAEKLETEKKVTEAETNRKNKGEEYKKGLDQALDVAVLEYLQDRLDAAEGGGTSGDAGDEADKELKKGKEDARRLIRQHLRNPKGKIKDREMKARFTSLMRDNPAQVMHDILSTTGLDPAMLEKLKTDDEFNAEVAMSVIRARMEKGKLTKEEINSLADTTWGEKAVTEALDKDERVKGLLDKLDKAGKLKGGSHDKNVIERFLGAVGKNKKAIILALLAALAVGLGYAFVAGHIAAEGLTIGAATSAGGEIASLLGADAAPLVAAGAAGGVVGYKVATGGGEGDSGGGDEHS